MFTILLFYLEVDNIKEDRMGMKYTKFQSPNGRGITAWETRRRGSILLKWTVRKVNLWA